MDIDWDAIKAEYISGKISCRKLAEKYNISPNVVSKKATKDGWKNERRKCDEKTAKKIISRTSYARACAAADGLDEVKYTSQLWMDNLKQLNELIKQTPETMLAQPSFAAGISNGLKTTLELFLRLGGQSDSDRRIRLEEEKLKMEREKFELEKARWEAEQAERKAAAAEGIKVVMELPEGVDFG